MSVEGAQSRPGRWQPGCGRQPRITEVLDHLRIVHNITQAAAAARMGLTPSAVSVQLGRGDISFNTLLRWSRVLNRPASEICQYFELAQIREGRGHDKS